MAKLGQDEIYQGTETFSEAFARIPKGAAEYDRLLDKWTAKVGELNDMGDEQEGYLLRYVENIEDIVDSWEEIDDYVEEVLKNLNTLGKTVSDVRDMANDILKDLQGTSRTVTERLRVIRNIRSLSEDITHSLQVEGGAHQKNLERLYKKAQVQREVGEYTRKMLGTEEDLHYRIWHLTAERKKELEKANGKETPYTQELQRQIKLQEANINLIKLQEQGVYRIAEAEAKRNLEANRSVRRGTKGLETVAKLAERAGFAGSQSMYEDYVQAQTKYASLGAEESELLSKKAGLEGKSDDASKALLLQTETRLQQIGIERAGVETRIRDLGGSQLGVAVNILKTGILNLGVLGLAAIAVKKIWTALKEVSSEAAKLQQNIGKFPYSIASANSEFASSKQYLETANELAQQFGQNPISFIGEKEIAKLAEVKNLLGLSAEQAGNVGIRSKIAGQNIDQYNESIVQGINQGNALNRSAVAHGVAMKEVLSTSDDLTLSLGNSGERLGRAIVAAKNLGMTLKDVDNIAGQLLNFESSIENEMKAQLLTGNQMNLSRARGLALQNDLEGVAKELTKQNITAEKFAGWNRIQQEQTAAALGMSREQLGKMLVTQAGLTKLTDDQVKAATGMTKEQLEAMGISERWKVAVDKLAQAFTPVLEAIMPIVTVISKLVTPIAGALGHAWVAWTALALAGIMTISSALVKLGKVGGGVMGGLRQGAVGFGQRIKSAFTGGGVRALFTPAAAGSAQTAGNMPAPKTRGEGWKSLGKGIASFFAAFKKVTFAEIGTAMAATVALVPIAALAPALGALATIGAAVGKGFGPLGKGLSSFFPYWKKVKVGDIGKALLATIALAPIAALAAPLGILASIGLLSSKAFPALGKGLAGFFKALGSIPPPMLLFASIAVAVITGALIGIGFALKLAAPAIEAVGNMIKSVLEGIGAVIESAAKGFTTLAEAVKGMSFEDIGKLALLGPTLLALGGSLLLATPGLLIGGIGLWVFTRRIKKLSDTGKGIPTLASGMKTLAQAVGELKASMSGLDTSKINDLAAASMKAMTIRGLSTVFRGIGKALGVSGGDGEIASANVRTQKAQAAARQTQSDEQAVTAQVNTAKIENLLTAIANRLNEGYDVYLDADKVGRTLAVRTTQG